MVEPSRVAKSSNQRSKKEYFSFGDFLSQLALSCLEERQQERSFRLELHACYLNTQEGTNPS